MWWFVSLALAQEPVPSDAPTTRTLPTIPAEQVRGADASLHVRADGAVYVNDEIVNDKDLEGAFGDLDRQGRLVVTADPEAKHGRITEVVEQAQRAGLSVVFQVEGSPVGPSSLFTSGAVEAEKLEDLSASDLREFNPKRGRLPQNPYANTDFTAYTLEWGETKVGIASITTGVLPRVQLGTQPVLDVIGVWNINAKANLVREGRVDGALLGQFYTAPVTRVVNQVTDALGYDQIEPLNYTLVNARYLGVGAMASVQVLDPWSIHLGGYYARVHAEGEFEFEDLPSFLIPGLEDELGQVGGEATIVPAITGELVTMRFATDYRFNRRDSIIFQYQGAIYARARAAADFSIGIEGVPEELPDGVEVGLAYGGMVPLKYSYVTSIAYQASWKHVDLRVGIGTSYVKYAWVLQPIELSYRFGGETRAEEGRIRRGYRANRRDLKQRDGGPVER